MYKDEYLTEYVRDSHGRKVGAVVAVGHGLIGWSKCHKNDSFDKDLARRIALGRAMNGSRTPIPSDVVPYFEKMSDRAARYYSQRHPR